MGRSASSHVRRLLERKLKLNLVNEPGNDIRQRVCVTHPGVMGFD